MRVATFYELPGILDYLKALDQAWTTERGFVYWLYGDPGEGKTAILRRWYEKRAPHFAKDRCLWYSFYKQGDPASRTATIGPCLEALAAQLNHTFENNRETKRIQDLATRIAEQPTILLLDGVEVLQDEPTEHGHAHFRDTGLPRLLKAISATTTPRVLVVITSREQLSEGNDPNDVSAAWIIAKKRVKRLNEKDGVRLLYRCTTGNKGQPIGILREKYITLVKALQANALALTILGSYVAQEHSSNIAVITPVHLRLDQTTKHGVHAQRVLDRILFEYEHNADRAPYLAVLRLLGLFQEHTTYEELATVLQDLIAAEVPCPVSPTTLQDVIQRLKDTRLVTIDGGKIDTHPLLRAGYAASLLKWPEAAREGHAALYICSISSITQATRIVEARRLFRAIPHAIASGKPDLIEHAFNDVYWKRCQHNKPWSRDNFAFHDLGLVSAGYEALLSFFDHKGRDLKESLALLPETQARLRAEMGVYLRARGLLTPAATLFEQAAAAYATLAETAEGNVSRIRHLMEAVTNDESTSEIRLLVLDGAAARASIVGARERFATVSHMFGNLSPAEREQDAELETDVIRRKIGVDTAHADVLQHFGNAPERRRAGRMFAACYKHFTKRFFVNYELKWHAVRPLYWFGYRLEHRDDPAAVRDTIAAFTPKEEINTSVADTERVRWRIPVGRPPVFWGIAASYAAEAYRMLGERDRAREFVGIAYENLRLAELDYHKPRGWLVAARVAVDDLTASQRPDGEDYARTAVAQLDEIEDLYKRVDLRLYQVEALLVRARLARLQNDQGAASEYWRAAFALSREYNYYRGEWLCNESQEYMPENA